MTTAFLGYLGIMVCPPQRVESSSGRTRTQVELDSVSLTAP